MDSESDWDTASEADTKSPKRINTHYPKIDGILEVPEEQNWNHKGFKQYSTDDEDEETAVGNYNSKVTENSSRNSSQRQSSAESSRKTPQKPKEAPVISADFKSALNDPITSKMGYKPNLPGKERKGHLYDAPQEEKGSWDSEDDARALADIRAVYEKGKTQEEHTQKQIASSAVVLEMKEAEPISKATKHFSKRGSVKEDSLPLRSGQAFYVEEEEETRIIYPFEEGHREYYDAVEIQSEAFLPHIADKSEVYIRRCWQEIFAALRILTGFLFIFMVELLLFILRDTIYKLFVKVIVILGNFLVKPLLSNVFNSFVQPVLIFVWNVLMGIRNMLAPVVDLSRSFVHQVVLVLGSFRLIEIKLGSGPTMKNASSKMAGEKAEEIPDV